MSTAMNPVLVLGMHRSGTSYLASILCSLGVPMGDSLVAAGEGNPHGHFEDLEIVEFHERLLKKRAAANPRIIARSTMVTEWSDRGFSPEEAEEAEELLAARQRSGLWGWKDPRTALFLDGWQGLRKGLRGIVIYRHPWSVHDSLLRRDQWEIFFNPFQVLRSYEIHNQALLEAVRRDRGRFLLLNADRAFADAQELRKRLQGFLGSALNAGGAWPPFHRSDFRTTRFSPVADEALEWVAPGAARAYCELNEMADLPAADPVGTAADSGARQTLAKLREFAQSWGAGATGMFLPMLEGLVFGKSSEQVAEARARLFARFCADQNGKNAWIEDLVAGNVQLAQVAEKASGDWEAQCAISRKLMAEVERLREANSSSGSPA